MKASLMIPQAIEKRILLIRGEKVLLSIDLAALYQVEHRALMQLCDETVCGSPMTLCSN